MNRLIIAFLVLAVAVESYGAERDRNDEELIEVKEVPRYTELLGWLNDVKRPGFQLRKASQQAGYFCAVFKTKDGDAAFCIYSLKPSDADSQGSELGVYDLQGNDLMQLESDRSKMLIRRFKVIESPDGVSQCNVFDGDVYPLLQPPPKKIRVAYRVRFNNGPKETVFDEIIDFD